MPASKDEAWAFTRRAQDLQAGEKRSFTAAPPRRKTTPAGAAAIGSDRGQIRVHTRSTRIRRRLAGPTVRPARQPILPSPPRASRHRHQAAPPPSTTTKRSLHHHHQPTRSGETAPSPPAQRPRRPAHPQAPPAAEGTQRLYTAIHHCAQSRHKPPPESSPQRQAQRTADAVRPSVSRPRPARPSSGPDWARAPRLRRLPRAPRAGGRCSIHLLGPPPAPSHPRHRATATSPAPLRHAARPRRPCAASPRGLEPVLPPPELPPERPAHATPQPAGGGEDLAAAEPRGICPARGGGDGRLPLAGVLSEVLT